MPHKVAFYPCSASDVREPLRLLAGLVDEVIFCDIRDCFNAPKQRPSEDLSSSLPLSTFRVGDARDVIQSISRIDLLFYRKDSEGEGGSRLFVLGDSVLPAILAKFPSTGGMIVTDGSNSRGSNFERMIRKSGLVKHGWKFAKAAEQPFLEAQKLYCIDVRASSPELVTA